MGANNVDYFELGGPDPERTMSFYSNLFGWQFGPESPAKYRMVNEDAGGLWDTSSMGGADYAIFYVHVDDVAAAVEQAVKLGATIMVPVTSNPAIEFAHLADPAGNRFGVWKPKSE